MEVGHSQEGQGSGRGICMVLSDEGSEEEEVLELRQDLRRLCDHRLIT